MADFDLNCEGLLCPMPVIKAQNKIKELAAGDRLTVTCTDPGTLHDIPAWCRINGHQMIEHKQDGRVISILIQVGTD